MKAGDALQIGTVVGVHGIKGYLKVLSYAESLEPFEPGRQVCLKQKGVGRGYYTVWDSRPYKNLLRVAFEAVNTRTEAEELIGADILIDRSELPEPEAGEWYWSDLMGLEVYEGGSFLGRVENIFATGSNDVLVVGRGKNERLIPAIESIVRHIDLDNKIMLVELPEGL